MNIGIIVAAGKGERTKLSYPKQFYQILGKSLLRIALEKYEYSELINKIVVVANEEFMEETKKECYNLNKVYGIIKGGESRQESVYNALKNIYNNFGFDVLFVSIHDAARPFVSIDKINEGIEIAKKYGSAILALPEKNSVSHVVGDVIDKILDRNEIFLHQTPQTFDFHKLYKAYTNFENELKSFTDDASIFHKAGNFVRIISGEEYNVKITTEFDLKFAKWLIKEGKINA
ncbi:2-C-methyl-D-erythritol 4-phosphate cytidylyltransferase [Marinitoga hydrogenitolerans DSM 16785]|uniref:2-C-methyl-D-erythritol 4-phosphate cytidylyltransferase n=1 Tax=Marinitoga hydrogenitolerans (strain DSM 16785 / JCM 12826 / AT1271) TaxID=1122195 RepID=A0A1M4TJP4_MARH1|nr:2-C-methyl-D-erythritol 4-phosphate cytidylyltransferase [Marinitoga hydrogenitolerans]SHE44584.1 2-C-methyl-D-erythritol 4-phosphate cytidylyltransferase [Marinitoga hydrogenitolerans DSM 16785]